MNWGLESQNCTWGWESTCEKHFYLCNNLKKAQFCGKTMYWEHWSQPSILSTKVSSWADSEWLTAYMCVYQCWKCWYILMNELIPQNITEIIKSMANTDVCVVVLFLKITHYKRTNSRMKVKQTVFAIFRRITRF